MLPPIEQWDLDTVREVAAPAFDESLELEKKASAKFDVSTKAAANETKAELAKQICAFANAGGGFIVYGAKDAKSGGGLDGGIDDLVGNQPVKDWVESLAPKLVHPPVTE